MFANRFTVVLDACVLAPALTRNLLLSLAEAELFRPRWSPKLMEEAERAIEEMCLARGRADASGEAARARDAMDRAFPEASYVSRRFEVASVTGWPHAADWHVVETALRADAALIVTDNLRHFPRKMLEPLGLDARSADDFIADTLDLPNDRETAIAAVREMRLRLKRPELSSDDLLLLLEQRGLTATAAILSHARGLW